MPRADKIGAFRQAGGEKKPRIIMMLMILRVFRII